MENLQNNSTKIEISTETKISVIEKQQSDEKPPIEKTIEQDVIEFLTEFEKISKIVDLEMEGEIENYISNLDDDNEKKFIQEVLKNPGESREKISEHLVKEFNNKLSSINKNLLNKLPVKIDLPEGSWFSKDELSYLRNRLTNSLKNISNFSINTYNSIMSDRIQIIKTFKPNMPIDNLDRIKVDLSIIGDDLHNQGKIPMLVKLTLDGDEFLRVVYKPRNAETDKSIIELFKDLNKLETTNTKLPTCEILDLGDNKGTIWEFVEGYQFSNGCHNKEANTLQELIGLKKDDISILGLEAANLINKIQDDTMKLKFQNNLERLQNVCKKIGVTDLHFENFILKNDMMLVLIDLEVIDPRMKQQTGLYPRDKEPKLTLLSEKEEELITKFNQDQKNKTCRITLVDTKVFKDNIHYLTRIKLIAQEISTLLIKNLNCEILQLNLENFVLQDGKNGDIPIFTLKDEVIYYGYPEQGNKIARLKN